MSSCVVDGPGEPHRFPDSAGYLSLLRLVVFFASLLYLGCLMENTSGTAARLRMFFPRTRVRSLMDFLILHLEGVMFAGS